MTWASEPRGLGRSPPHEFLWGESIFPPSARIGKNVSVVTILREFETKCIILLRLRRDLLKNHWIYLKTARKIGCYAVSCLKCLIYDEQFFFRPRTIYRRKFSTRTNFGAPTCLLVTISLRIYTLMLYPNVTKAYGYDLAWELGVRFLAAF